MAELLLTGGQTIQVDDDRWDELSEERWSLGKDGLVHRFYTPDGKSLRTEKLSHRVFGKPPEGLQVGFIGDRMDYRRQNLRLGTHAQHHQNMRKTVGVSGYRGVYYRPGRRRKHWQAALQVDGKMKSVGYFEKPEEAAVAAREARRKYMPYATN